MGQNLCTVLTLAFGEDRSDCTPNMYRVRSHEWLGAVEDISSGVITPDINGNSGIEASSS